jgi:cytochrome P450
MTLPSSAPDVTEGCPVQSESGRVSLTGPLFHTDPQRLYREVRRVHGPVVPVDLPGGFPAWLVVGYRELHQITSEPELFPRDARLWNQWPNIPEDWPLRPMVAPDPSMYGAAGEEHRRHLVMVEPALEAVDSFELRRVCEQLADQLIDRFCGRGEADLVAEFSEPLPALALAWMLGFTEADGIQVALTLKTLADGGPEAQGAYLRFMEHMQHLVATKKVRPGADVASRMLAHPARFTDQEYVLDLMAVTAGGQLPTADWIANSMRLMLTDDRFAAALGGGRRSVGQAMNEVLWEDTPTQILAGRWAVRDTLLADKSIRAGDLLLLGLGAANADPHVRQHFADGVEPVHAGNSAHFSFSYGDYRCPFPAQEIAEILARTGIEVLLDRLPDLDLAVPAQNLVRRPSAFLRGIISLPVRFTPVRATRGMP